MFEALPETELTAVFETRQLQAEMTEPVAKRQRVTDSEVTSFVNGIEQRQVANGQDSFAKEDVLSVSYMMGRLISAVEKITRSPSGGQVALFKGASVDAELVKSLDDPYVELALKLKEAYDQGKLPLFDSLLEFKDRTPVELQPDRILDEFSRRAPSFLPGLPEIKDEYLKQKVFSNDVSDDLVQVGRGKLQAAVSELLALRFPEHGVINQITKYLFSHSVARTWARLFGIPINNKTDPAELFYAHFGASSLSNVIKPDKDYLKTFVTILVEPVVSQFDRTAPDYAAKDELDHKGAQITYKRTHSTTYNNTGITMVSVIAGGGDASVLLGFSSATSELDAQAKAAASAVQNPSQLARLLNNLKDLEQYLYQGKPPGAPGVPSSVAQAPVAASAPVPVTAPQPYGAVAPHQPVYGQQPHPQQPVYGQTQQVYPQQAYGQPGFGHAPQTSTTLVPAATASTAVIPITTSVVALDNQYNDAYLVTDIPDVEIDNNSKANLNRLLIDNRYDAADYKTTKLNNSDVQVTCIIGGKPISRAISNNKKKAGQMCAQCILKYEDYFFTTVIPPPR